MREKRLGLFGNAKYSRPVFKNVPEAVMKGVEKDIALLVRHEPAHEMRKWTMAPRASGDAIDDSMASAPAAVEPPGVSLLAGRPTRRNLFPRAAELPSSRHVPAFQRAQVNAIAGEGNNNGDPTRHLRELLSDGSAEVKRRRLETSQTTYMPTVPPMESITAYILAACPRITLRGGDGTHYTEQVFAITHGSLRCRNATSSTSEPTTGVDSATAAVSGVPLSPIVHPVEQTSRVDVMRPTKVDEPFQTLCNKTAIFDEDDSDAFEENDALDTESPTRILGQTGREDGSCSRSKSNFNASAFHTQSDSDVEEELDYRDADVMPVGGGCGASMGSSRSGVSTWKLPSSSRNAFFGRAPTSFTNKSASFRFEMDDADFGGGHHNDKDDDNNFPRVQSPVPSSSLIGLRAPTDFMGVRNEQNFFQQQPEEEMFLDNLSFDFGANNASSIGK